MLVPFLLGVLVGYLWFGTRPVPDPFSLRRNWPFAGMTACLAGYLFCGSLAALLDQLAQAAFLLVRLETLFLTGFFLFFALCRFQGRPQFSVQRLWPILALVMGSTCVLALCSNLLLGERVFLTRTGRVILAPGELLFLYYWAMLGVSLSRGWMLLRHHNLRLQARPGMRLAHSLLLSLAVVHVVAGLLVHLYEGAMDWIGYEPLLPGLALLYGESYLALRNSVLARSRSPRQ